MYKEQRPYHLTEFKRPPSVVRDYNLSQGVTHPSDLSIHIVRDINLRYVTVENSSPYTKIGVGVADSFEANIVPPIRFILYPGEIRHLGINTFGERMQYLYIIDLITNKSIGQPYPFRTDGNSFVLREGINKWFVQTFRRPSYAAAK